MRPPIYLDYAATTPVDSRVAEAMCRYLTRDGVFGNPSSGHGFGRAAAQAVETARAQVASLVNADPDEIIWTSGATESNNLALKGAAYYYAKKGRHLITCKTEHKAVLDPCRQLEREGWQVSYLEPEPTGLVNLGHLTAALRPDTVLVSLLQVNNETGVVQDVAAIGQLTRERGVLLHVDAAQSAGKLPIDLATLPVDLMSFSAHKVYGPKGIGALYVRRRPKVRLTAQLHGGGQEHGLRAGTLATHQIVGMGAAFAIAQAEIKAETARVLALRERLWQGIRALQAVYLNGDSQQRVAGILNVSFDGMDGEALRAAIREIAVSSGSACTAALAEPSHVLLALGRSKALARCALRFSLGRFTTLDEIDYTVDRVQAAVARLRELSPVWKG
ncbi:MAG: IscS subfamily cysteine desulfurase [Candidatus Competibacteraceae bacterium]